MSVSLSSVWEQTQSLKQIEDKFELAASNQSSLCTVVEDIVQQTSSLTMAENYRLMAILSKHLNSNSSVPKKFAALYTIKQLLLTALHHHYVFASVKALRVIANLTQFEGKKSEFERVKLYVRQLSLKGNGDDIVQQRYCYRLLKFADEFLSWFAINIPTHINAQFVYKSTFARKLQELKYRRDTKTYQFFKDVQFNKFEQNFNANRAINVETIKQLSDFVSLQVQSAIEQRKLKSELLFQLVRTADSYCIRAIMSELCNIIQDNSKLFYCLKLAQSLMNVGQIEFIELTKLYLVPAALHYIVPYNFASGAKLKGPSLSCSPSQQKYVVDCICIWKKMTQRVGLSCQFYKRTIEELEKQKREVLIVQQKNLNEFMTNIIDLQGVNENKKQYIRQPHIEKQLMAVFDNAANDNKYKQKLLNESAINSLDEFKQSNAQVVTYGKPKQQTNQRQPIFVQSYNFNNTANKNQPNMKLVHRNTPNFPTFKDLPQSIALGSPNKQVAGDRQVKQEQSSFMAFNESNFSKFSEYSVKRSQLSNKKIAQTQNKNSTCKNQSISSKNLRTSQPMGESGSIVYFGRSEDFRSQASMNNKQKFPSKILSQKESIHNEIQKVQQKEDNVSNYKFQQSSLSKSSSASSIHHYGINNSNFPQPASKPSFGFKKKNIQILKSNDSIVSENQNMIQIQQMKASNKSGVKGQIRESNLRNSNSLDSGIKDLSGGRHLFKNAIKSPFDSNQNSSFSKDIQEGPQQQIYNNKMGSTNNFKLTPQIQYYTQESKKLGHNRGINIKQQKNLIPIQNASGKNNNFGQKHLLNPYQIQKSQEEGVKNGKKYKVNIIDKFGNDKLLDLEKQLGKAMEEKNLRQIELKKKQNEFKLLKSMSVPYMGKKMQNLKKENEIIKILASQKNKEDYVANAEQLIKPISSKNRITDYFLQNKVQNKFVPLVQPFDRAFTKQILGSRCLLIANQNLELGYNYSLRQNQISLYITFLKAFDSVKLVVIQNSLMLQKQVNLILADQPAGYQLKLKRKVKGVTNLKKQQTFLSVANENKTSLYKFPSIKIAVAGLEGEIQMETLIPCSVFNLTQPIQINKQVVETLKQKKASRSEPLPLCKQFNRNYKQKVEKYFPHHMALVEGWKLIGFRFPASIFGLHEDEFYKIRITNGKQIQIQCLGDDKSLLAQTLACMLTK